MATLGVKGLNVFHHDSSLNDVLSKTNLKNQIKPQNIYSKLILPRDTYAK